MPIRRASICSGIESLIMQQSDINSISDAIKDCLRCGKCKPVCATHVPRANLLYSPRNKILATSLLIEAFLYEEQTRRGVSLRHWDEFADVADHCTVCHKCETPCPVDIDFGDVSMAMRDLLRRMGKKRFNPGTAASMFFLNATNPETIKLARTAMIEWGFKAQRMGEPCAQRIRRRHKPSVRLRPPAKRPYASRWFTSSTRRCRAACRRKPLAPCWTSKTGTTCRSFVTRCAPPAIPKRCFIFRAAAPNDCSRRWAWRRRRCCGRSACRPSCRPATCAAVIRSAAPASSTRPRRSSPTIACCSIASPTRSTISTSRQWWLAAAPVSISCKATSSKRSSPAAASSTSTSS